MKTRAGYWIAGGLALVGVAGAVVWLVVAALSSLGPLVDGFLRVPVPGRTTVNFTARTYHVYDESVGSSVAPARRVQIIDLQSGGRLAIRSSDNLTETYSIGASNGLGERNGVLRGTVTAPHAGQYLIRTGGARSGLGATIAFGDSLLAPSGRQLGTALAIGFALAGLGLGLAGVTFARRRSLR